MLHLILGRAGSGRTSQIRKLIVKRAGNGEKNMILLVPEQCSFDNERQLLTLLGASCTRQVEVLSFTRLAEQLLGGEESRAASLTDSGRIILMNLALLSMEDRLELYRGHLNDPAFATEALHAADEFKMCAARPQAIEQCARTMEESTLRQKLTELSAIYAAYDALVETSAADPKDLLTRLADRLAHRPLFAGKTVFIDSFKGFTGQELEVLSHIMRQAEDVYVTLGAPSLGEIPGGLFHPVQETAKQLIKLARRWDVPVAAPEILPKSRRFCSAELLHLEENVFLPDGSGFEGECGSIQLYEASGLHEEAEFVARTIRRLAREQGLYWRDFAVIGRGIERYEGILDAALKKYGVPFFMDRREPVDASPLIAFVQSALEAAQGMQSDSIFRMLKTGLSSMTVEEVSELENYVLLWGINGRRWLTEWEGHPDGFGQPETEESRETLRRINSLREKAVGPLLAFRQQIKEGTGAQMARAVYDFLQQTGVPDRLLETARTLQAEDGELSSEQLRVWELLMEVLSELHDLVGDMPVKADRFASLLQQALGTRSLGHIPQGLDEVSVGDAERMRPASPKVVFVIGANEGIFPKAPSGKGLLNDADRRFLIDRGILVAKPLDEEAEEERYLAYMALTSASHRVFVSCPAQSPDGEALSPSIIWTQMKKLFPKVRVQRDSSLSLMDQVEAERPAFELAALHWRAPDGQSAALRQYFAGRTEYESRVQLLRRAAGREAMRFQNPQAAKALFGARMRLSASRVEQYHLCRFSYFCRYGLGAKPRKAAQLDALEYGTIIHFLLEHLLRTHGGAGLGEVGKEQLEQEIDALMARYLDEKMGGRKDKPERFLHLFDRMKHTALLLVRQIAQELSQSAFQPVDLELSISEHGEVPPLCIRLPDGGEIAVEGKVDRVDVMEEDGKSFVRVVDYKTGSKQFRLSDILYGLNMQMLLYLAAIQKNGEARYGRVVPAGVLYLPSGVSSPIAGRNADSEEVGRAYGAAMKMNGLILDDERVIRGMEPDAAGVFIPVKLKKDGSPDAYSSVASLAQMGRITQILEKNLVDMACTLQKGDVAAIPATGSYQACQWCDYAAVCGHEEGDACREIADLDRKQVLRLLSEEETEGGV
ncbi:MAG: helicase [Clostridiales bacterium]|nr:helicase [Clostridiales bacterium]